MPTATVLLVDDNDSDLELEALAIKEAGHKVVEARSGQQALEILEEEAVEFDLVLTDVKMPGMSGHDLLREISNKWPDLPVAFISGESDLDSAIRAVRASAYDYLVKSFTKDELELLMRRLSRDKSLEAENGPGH